MSAARTAPERAFINAIRKVILDGQPLQGFVLNGIAASVDATDTTPPSTIYATFVDPKTGHGGVLAMPGF